MLPNTSHQRTKSPVKRQQYHCQAQRTNIYIFSDFYERKKITFRLIECFDTYGVKWNHLQLTAYLCMNGEEIHKYPNKQWSVCEMGDVVMETISSRGLHNSQFI